MVKNTHMKQPIHTEVRFDMISKNNLSKLYDLYESLDSILNQKIDKTNRRFDLDIKIGLNSSTVLIYEWFIPTTEMFNVLSPKILKSLDFYIHDDNIDYIIAKVTETLKRWGGVK